MRKSMRPVSLSRVVEVALIAEKEEEINYENLSEKLNISIRRSREIINEMDVMNLLENDEQKFIPTQECRIFNRAVLEEDWESIHSVLMNYPFYSQFYNYIDRNGPVELSNLESGMKNSEYLFNKTSISIISDWTLRIGLIQRNVFNDHYYSINSDCINFPDSFARNYSSLDTDESGFMKKRYISIPKLREFTCENLKISRIFFDKSLIELYNKNIGIIEFSGAPVTTSAKKSKKKIKSAVFSNIPEWTGVELRSDKYLSGIKIGKKEFIYVAIHGSINNE
ncbi:hypothetical protein [Methanoplanus limicola]|uniref:Uncharacterized protein n=1 Tax=Methanoplanus limicola DSM 2279 TaxID=937775 RepID=H1Z094_9EURY|nr:hypothetical protein [Methanoplanus limicola]EHQ36186.1 hypothetical protein Metlim_2104 [Methanoplanus limicola DSM 2279]